MSEIHEKIEKAHEGALAEGLNKRIALLIAVLALFLSFSETFGKSAQTEAIDANVKSSDTWAFSGYAFERASHRNRHGDVLGTAFASTP